MYIPITIKTSIAMDFVTNLLAGVLAGVISQDVP